MKSLLSHIFHVSLLLSGENEADTPETAKMKGAQATATTKHKGQAQGSGTSHNQAPEGHNVPERNLAGPVALSFDEQVDHCITNTAT